MGQTWVTVADRSVQPNSCFEAHASLLWSGNAYTMLSEKQILPTNYNFVQLCTKLTDLQCDTRVAQV